LIVLCASNTPCRSQLHPLWVGRFPVHLVAHQNLNNSGLRIVMFLLSQSFPPFCLHILVGTFSSRVLILCFSCRLNYHVSQPYNIIILHVLNLMFVPCIIRSSRNNQHNAQICTTALFYTQAPTCFGSTMPSSGSF
jgi:hypothetical protein